MKDNFKKLLQKSLQKAGITKQVQASLVLEDYTHAISEIFGKAIEDKARPIHLKEGVLSVACISSVVAQELKFKEQEILEKINSEGKIVDRVRYVL